MGNRCFSIFYILIFAVKYQGKFYIEASDKNHGQQNN